ncbi:MAG: hypothetical protein ACYC5F_00860 [Thermoleophilia bacterium]
MKKNIIIVIVTIGIVGIGAMLVVSGCGSGSSSGTSNQPQGTNSQVLPVANDPIKNNATAPGLVIVSAQVEDNVDPATNQAIPDKLQLSLKNTSSQTMSNFEIFYRMTDSTTGVSEGYYEKLDGLSLGPNETKTIFFDNQSSPNHYPENKYSLYRTSKNEVRFTIELSTPGFKLATGETKKSVGTGEKQD